ncbi:hypothetical protein G6F68_010010 [Rhizopus microsporus]|nr:hypothetical protein G6F68_010010 [Rhizopus microsporus]
MPQPAVRLKQQGQRRHPGDGIVDHVQAVLQLALREHEQARAHHGAIHGAHTADHQHQQDVQHDLERQRGVRPVVAQPKCVHGAGQRGEGGRQQIGQATVQHRAKPDGFGAEGVFANGLQHAAERRIHDTQQHQEQHSADRGDQVVSDDAAVDRHAEQGFRQRPERRAQHLGHFEVQAVFAARQVRQLRHQRLERSRDRQRDHGGERQRHDQRATDAGEHRGPAGLHMDAGDRDAVGADAEEHGVREAHDAGVAQQQVVAGDKDHEHQDLGGHGQRFGTGKEKRRCGKQGDDGNQYERQEAVRDRIHALWAPQQDGDHQRDIREQGGFGHKEAGVVGHQAHQQRPDHHAPDQPVARRQALPALLQACQPPTPAQGPVPGLPAATAAAVVRRRPAPAHLRPVQGPAGPVGNAGRGPGRPVPEWPAAYWPPAAAPPATTAAAPVLPAPAAPAAPGPRHR